MDAFLHRIEIESGSVRVPEPVAGTATVVRRYRRPQAVILHPEDFQRLTQDSDLIGRLGRPTPLAPATPLARKAHLLVETPGAEAPLLEDGEALEALLAQADA
ncbi:MAG TPA: hypothetical protein VID29_06670 [Solirubrobacteraceae bacterium]|jgi:hypothetical protein